MKTTKTESKETSTAISTQGQFTQADIPALLATVNKKIGELSKTGNVKPTIDVDLPGFGRIEKHESVLTLLQAAANVDGKLEAYNASAAKHLPEGIKAPAFTLAGHSHKAWIEVIQIKIAEVAHKKELEKLKAVKATLESNLSAEMKLANDLKNISKLLSED